MSKDTLCWIGRYQADKTSGVPAPVLPLQQGPPLSPCSVGSFHHGHSDVAIAALPQSQEHHQVHSPRSPGTDRNLVHMLQVLIAMAQWDTWSSSSSAQTSLYLKVGESLWNHVCNQLLVTLSMRHEVRFSRIAAWHNTTCIRPTCNIHQSSKVCG